MRQITPTTSCDGSTYRITPNPTHCRVAGELRPIANVVSVAHDAVTGVYRVTNLADGEWIEFAPQKRCGRRARLAVVKPDGFGDVLKPDSGYDFFVQYNVRASGPGVMERTATGWRFKSISDVPLGVDMGDWLGRFGGRATLGSDLVTLDTVGLSPDANGEINLDPSIVATNARSKFVTGQADWDTAIGEQGAPAVLAGSRWQIIADSTAGSSVASRIFTSYATSSLPDSIIAAHVELTSKAGYWDHDTANAGYVLEKNSLAWAAGYSDLWNDVSNGNSTEYSRLALLNVGHTGDRKFVFPITDLDAINTSGETVWTIRSIWDADANADPVGLTPPVGTTNLYCDNNNPTLVVTLAGGMMLMGAG